MIQTVAQPGCVGPAYHALPLAASHAMFEPTCSHLDYTTPSTSQRAKSLGTNAFDKPQSAPRRVQCTKPSHNLRRWPLCVWSAVISFNLILLYRRCGCHSQRPLRECRATNNRCPACLGVLIDDRARDTRAQTHLYLSHVMGQLD